MSYSLNLIDDKLNLIPLLFCLRLYELHMPKKLLNTENTFETAQNITQNNKTVFWRRTWKQRHVQ
jgi:hypothetical protein